MVLAGDGDDIIRAGNGRQDLYWGGEGADTYVFSEARATDGTRDKTLILDFDTAEDSIDLGGAQISGVREFFNSVRISLDGGRDRIDLLGVSEFDEIIFVNDTVLV